MEFSCSGWVRTEFRTQIFFPLSRPMSSVLAKNNAGKRFFNFFNFFAIFCRIFFPRPSMTGNRGKIFFFLFFGLSTPVLAKSNSRKRFFDFFFYFFRNFLAQAEYERYSELKFFFSLFRSISSRFG